MDISKISLLCFFASYLVALLLDLATSLAKLRLWSGWSRLWTFAGLVAHTAYLCLRAQESIQARGIPLANWYDWCLLASWAVALGYLLLSVLRPGPDLGLFLLPAVLALILVARAFPRDDVFRTEQAAKAWGMLHGMGLLGGTVLAFFGLASGFMYLLQSRRLKSKSPNWGRLRLPSLEWLGHANQFVLTWSTFLLVIGILAGFVMNIVVHGLRGALDLQDRAVPVSLALILWLIGVSIFSRVYRPARTGRKVAYLTLANFVILALTLAIVLTTRHATPPSTSRADDPGEGRPAATTSREPNRLVERRAS